MRHINDAGLSLILSDAKRRDSLERRLWASVDKKANDDCWEWTGNSVASSGYGRLTVGRGAQVRAHRAVWALTHGDPGSSLVCHKCDNPRCCNPHHLFLGSHKENSQDARNKGRLKLAIKLGVTPKNISDVIYGRVWRHVP